MITEEQMLEQLEYFTDKMLVLYPDIGIESVSWGLDIKGECAGRAYMNRSHIAINPEIPEDGLAETIAHELAHLISFKLGGIKQAGHGKLWKRVLGELGFEPRRTHDYKLEKARKERKWDYVCPCGIEFKVYTRKHKKVQDGRMTLRCQKCGGVLQDMNQPYRLNDKVLTGE